MIQLGKIHRLVARMPPQARRKMHRRIHDERVEANLLFAHFSGD
jgi:hypothetical protein